MRIVAALLLLAAGCDDGAQEPIQCKEGIQQARLHLDSSLDLLLVVGNASSMTEERAALSDQARWVLDRLRELPRGLPDLHLAVVSDDGSELLVPDGCPALTDGQRFLSDVLVDDETGTREFNVAGDLADQLACMVATGSVGAGSGQPLDALAGAVEDAGSGFRRTDAALAIAIVTDGEDSSPDQVSLYADRVRARAPAPAPVAVSVVSGGPEGCVLDGFTDAAPAPRLAAFAGAFGTGGSAVSLCAADPLLGELAAALGDLTAGACIGDEVPSPPDCRVSDVWHGGLDDEEEYPLLPCDQATTPCFAIAPDLLRCPDTSAHLRLTLDRGGMPPPEGSSTLAVCSVGPECPP